MSSHKQKDSPGFFSWQNLVSLAVGTAIGAATEGYAKGLARFHMLAPMAVGTATGIVAQEGLSAWLARGYRKHRQTQISGLRHSGVSGSSRKKMTEFGSGWQGLSKGMTVEFEEVEPKKFFGVLKHEGNWAGYMTYTIKPGGVAAVSSTEVLPAFQGMGHGQSLYVEAMRHAKSRGAIKFRSDVKIDPKTGEQAVSSLAEERIWNSATRRGIAEKIEGERGWVANLFKLEENLMKSGEGAAISRAGTAEVPAVLRTTARIIKNAL